MSIIVKRHIDKSKSRIKEIFNKNLGTKKANICCMLMLKISYEVIFAMATSKVYAYIGLWYEPNMSKMIVSYLIAIALVIVMPQNSKKVSNYAIYVFFYFTILPLLSIYWQQNQSSEYIVFCVTGFLVMCLACEFFGKLTLGLSIQLTKSKINIELVLLFICIGLTTVSTWLYGIPSLRALDFNGVYELRSEKTYSGLGGYIINWLPKVFIPSLLTVSLYNRKKKYAIFAIALQFYMYLMTGNKTVFFSIFFILGIYFLTISFKSRCMYYLAIGLMALHIIGSVLFYALGNTFLFSTISYRLTAVPANVSYQHFNFFSIHPKLHFAENAIGRLFGINSPYPIVSTYMLGYEGSSANTGILGDAYDNGGLIVMIIYMFIFGIILAYIDKQTKKMNNRLRSTIVALISYSIICLNDTSLTTVFTTGGLFIVLIIIHILKEQASYNNCNEMIDLLT